MTEICASPSPPAKAPVVAMKARFRDKSLWVSRLLRFGRRRFRRNSGDLALEPPPAALEVNRSPRPAKLSPPLTWIRRRVLELFVRRHKIGLPRSLAGIWPVRKPLLGMARVWKVILAGIDIRDAVLTAIIRVLAPEVILSRPGAPKFRPWTEKIHGHLGHRLAIGVIGHMPRNGCRM